MTHKAFTSLYFLEAGRSVAQVRQAAQTLLHDAKYGHVLRVKGFIPDGGGWVELNAARDAITVQPIPSGQEVLIVIGEGLLGASAGGSSDAEICPGDTRHCRKR